MSFDTRTDIRLVRLCCLFGLLGSVLFLTGDMLFYGNWVSGAEFHPYSEMAARSLPLLIAGGAIGPVAALFSACGMGIFYWTLESGSRKWARTAAVLLAVMMLIAGSYHALYTCLGFAVKVTDKMARETLLMQVTSLRDAVYYPTCAMGAAGTALVYLLALSKKTRFPRWLLILLPTTLSLASSAFRSYFLTIPAPIGGIVRGGWINGSFVLFFTIATYVF
ncbi:MAG: hypothetical protein JO182_03670, partial [Acidobacteriaceae bacterium]|nr:hypothetical protein [Acidobacteriaceae bacterium]